MTRTMPELEHPSPNFRTTPAGGCSVTNDLLTVGVAKSESVVTVITSELLSVCVAISAIVPVTCASCLRNIREKSSCSIILLVGPRMSTMVI
ncbi:hypothetical protein AVEN_96166-1 [Araneus ventricosus]|uniref:Uncharacterized protein n=1 Tax=Araneus ventricosus TaxID=182803 RepID=A0A4Y2H5K1_ARAVE|nr:hypothetical protein AVEN_96166-1 [Araneus ventricosus]